MTAVQWLDEQIKDMIPINTITQGKYKELIKKAKQMEKKMLCQCKKD
jgi:hypothetical protein